MVVDAASGRSSADSVLDSGISVAVSEEPCSEWVLHTVWPVLPEPTHATVRELRDDFWSLWRRWHDEGALLAADVCWPVESLFLAACVADDPEARTWEGPYPLVDTSSIRLAAGFVPTAIEERLPSEEPVHNPEADARQSARLLLEALASLRSRR